MNNVICESVLEDYDYEDESGDYLEYYEASADYDEYDDNSGEFDDYEDYRDEFEPSGDYEYETKYYYIPYCHEHKGEF